MASAKDWQVPINTPRVFCSITPSGGRWCARIYVDTGSGIELVATALGSLAHLRWLLTPDLFDAAVDSLRVGLVEDRGAALFGD